MVIITDNIGCSMEQIAIITNADGLTVTYSSVGSGCGSASGTISIVASNGVEPYQYQLNNEIPQSSPDFSVGPGSYEVTTTDASGCSFVVTVQLTSTTSYQSDIKPIIMNSCAVTGCHDGSQPARANFNNFSEVQANASLIKSKTQNGSMPKTGSLTQAQIDLIACWVDDGALDN